MYNPDASLKFLFRGKGGILRLVAIPRREFLRLAGKVLFLECSTHFSGSRFYYTAKYIPGRGGITEQRSRIFPTSDFEWTIAHGEPIETGLGCSGQYGERKRRRRRKKKKQRFRPGIRIIRWKIISTPIAVIYGWKEDFSEAKNFSARREILESDGRCDRGDRKTWWNNLSVNAHRWKIFKALEY